MVFPITGKVGRGSTILWGKLPRVNGIARFFERVTNGHEVYWTCFLVDGWRGKVYPKANGRAIGELPRRPTILRLAWAGEEDFGAIARLQSKIRRRSRRLCREFLEFSPVYGQGSTSTLLLSLLRNLLASS
jgi:hypothetical protein